MSFTGVWMNELNSVRVLNEHPDQGLTGKYGSMVGRDPNVRDLSGRTSAVEGGKQMVVDIRGVLRDRRARPGDGHFSVCAWSGWSEKGSARESGGHRDFGGFGVLDGQESSSRRCWGNVGTRVRCGFPSAEGEPRISG